VIFLSGSKGPDKFQRQYSERVAGNFEQMDYITNCDN